jgi:hypothetical protein
MGLSIARLVLDLCLIVSRLTISYPHYKEFTHEPGKRGFPAVSRGAAKA